MSEKSYLVEMEDDLETPSLTDHHPESPPETQRVGILSSFSTLLSIGGSLPPFHATFQETTSAFAEGLSNLGALPHRPPEVHVVRQGQHGASRFAFVGPKEDPVQLSEGFEPGWTPEQLDDLIQFLRRYEIALLTFETGLTKRSLSRLVQLALSLKGGQECTLRERIQFSGIKGVHVLHIKDVDYSTSPDSPWLERIAATRVRSLLMRLPNPAQLESWLHRGEGGELVRRALFSIGTQTSLTTTLEALVSMPSPGKYSHLLDLVLDTLSREDLLELAGSFGKGSPGGTRTAEVALSLGVQLHKVGEPEAAHLLETLYRGGKVPLESLPEDVRRAIRISSWTQAFDAKPFEYLQRLQTIPTAEGMGKELNALGHVYRDLIEDQRFGNAELLVRYIMGLRQRLNAEPDKAAEVEEFLERLERVPLGDVADAYLDSVDMGFKGEVLTFLTTSGPRGLPSLFTLLSECESGEDRSHVCNAMIRMGERAHMPLISSLNQAQSPWYVRRNVLYILGKLGIPGEAETYCNALLDEDARVQKEAATAFIKTEGRDSWSPIFQAARASLEFRFHGCQLLVLDGFEPWEDLKELIWAGLEESFTSSQLSSRTLHWLGLLVRIKEAHGPLLGDMNRAHQFSDQVKAHCPDSNGRASVCLALEGIIT